MDTAQLIEALNREHWSPRLQRVYFVENTAVFLAGTDAAATLSSDGKKTHKPIMGHVVDGEYTPGTDITDSSIEAEDQNFEVDVKRYASAYVDAVSARQNYYGAVTATAQHIQRQLNNRIEQHFLSKVTQAENSLAAGTIDDTNIIDVVNDGHTLLDVNDVPASMRALVAGPSTIKKMRKAKLTRETQLGDSVLANGVIGPWLGVTVVQNNNLPWTGTLAMSSQPANDATVKIAGVTVTYKTTLTGSGNNEILRGADAAASRANTIAFFTRASGAGTTYNAATRKDDFKLLKRGISVSESGTNLVFTGYGDISVTGGTLSFTSATQNLWFGMRGATDLVVQIPPRPTFVDVEKRFGVRAKALSLYGANTFEDGAMALVNITQNAINF